MSDGTDTDGDSGYWPASRCREGTDLCPSAILAAGSLENLRVIIDVVGRPEWRRRFAAVSVAGVLLVPGVAVSAAQDHRLERVFAGSIVHPEGDQTSPEPKPTKPPIAVAAAAAAVCHHRLCQSPGMALPGRQLTWSQLSRQATRRPSTPRSWSSSASRWPRAASSDHLLSDLLWTAGSLGPTSSRFASSPIGLRTAPLTRLRWVGDPPAACRCPVSGRGVSAQWPDRHWSRFQDRIPSRCRFSHTTTSARTWIPVIVSVSPSRSHPQTSPPRWTGWRPTDFTPSRRQTSSPSSAGRAACPAGP